uniref:Uncharacterized protein n=1 Tax=Pelusios castaneus TaxID=367368 RepID=A0A8C8RSN3_9SAUR
MGKNKGPKQKCVFHLARSRLLKAKHKAKPVTTCLMVNKALTEVQKENSLHRKFPSVGSCNSSLLTVEDHKLSNHFEIWMWFLYS